LILNGLPPLDEGKWRKIEPPAPLPATPSPSRDAVAAHWRAAEHYAKTQAGRDLKRSRYPQATKDLKAAAGVARARLRPDPLPDVPHLSLANFPQAFLPLTIILGDRREWPLKSPGDLLAWSPSMLDVMHLHRLGLGHALEQGKDVQIMSDKYFVDLDDDGLSVRLNDRHLLSIGSPAANLGTRFLNAGAFFPFAPAGAERWVRARGNLRALLRTPERLRGFADYIDHEGIS